MDDDVKARARARSGVVARGDLGRNAVRDARRARLEQVQRGAFVASTQPYGVTTQLASLHVSHPDAEWCLAGAGALWIYGVLDEPPELVVVIPVASELAIRWPVRRRRVAPSVLRGARVLNGTMVVALEVAVIQWAVGRPAAEVLALIERLVRERRTTVFRLRSRLTRGLAGSTAVRRAVDELAGGSMEKDVRRLKAALEARGVTGLEPEVRFTNAANASAYADLLHRPTMTLIEVDAALDHLERKRFRADRRRDRWVLTEHGAVTLRIDITEIRADLDEVADEVASYLLREAVAS